MKNCGGNFELHNFVEITYKDQRNRKQPKYLLSKDGFTLLVMGYTGKKAMQFKIAYINRFNQMENFIKSLLATKEEFPLSSIYQNYNTVDDLLTSNKPKGA